MTREESGINARQNLIADEGNFFEPITKVRARGQELIIDIISMSLWGGASINAKYEPQNPLHPPERFVQKSIFNS